MTQDDGLYNIHDFLGKIDWEGGLYSALEYGLSTRDYDLPKDVQDAWEEVRYAFSEMQELVDDFWRVAGLAADNTPEEF